MGRPPGKTKTFPRVVELLTAAVKEKGQKAIEAETKLSQSMISRYLKGEGEPSQATLEKLAAYFGVTVVYLRGETPESFTDKWLKDKLGVSLAWLQGKDRDVKITTAAIVLASLEKEGVHITEDRIRRVFHEISGLDLTSIAKQFFAETGMTEEGFTQFVNSVKTRN